MTPLLDKGFRRISKLLDDAGFSPEQVALCVATGGMSNMPADTAPPARTFWSGTRRDTRRHRDAHRRRGRMDRIGQRETASGEERRA